MWYAALKYKERLMEASPLKPYELAQAVQPAAEERARARAQAAQMAASRAAARTPPKGPAPPGFRLSSPPPPLGVVVPTIRMERSGLGVAPSKSGRGGFEVTYFCKER
jgi:hypothetical protein